MQNPRGQMHPDDKRNLMIFVVLSFFLYLAFDHFVLAPQLEARQAMQERLAEEAAKAGAASEALPESQTAEPVELKDRTELIRTTAQRRLRFSNGEMEGSIDLLGGRINDMILLNYFETLEQKNPVKLLTPAGAPHAEYVELGWLATDETLAVPGRDAQWQVVAGDRLRPDAPVTIAWDNGQGLRFEREIAMDDQYLFTVTQRVVNQTAREVSLSPYGFLVQHGLPAYYANRAIVHEGPIAYLDGELEERAYKKLQKKEQTERLQAQTGWIGVSQKYWFTGFVPDQESVKTFRFLYRDPPAGQEDGRFQVDYVSTPIIVPPSGSASYQTHVFSGPKSVKALDAYEEQLGVTHFDLVVDFGWLYFLTKPLYYLLMLLGDLIGNYGFAIVIMTLMVRLAVFPLAHKSYKSFAKLKVISPEMKELREKHKGDTQALQKEMAALYEREGVNPVSGCLPILLQFPIFIALYKTLLVSIEMRHAPFIGWVEDLSAKDPTNIFTLFGMLSWDLPGFLHLGIWPVLMFCTLMFLRTLSPPPQDPAMRGIHDAMPFVMLLIVYRFPVGLVIYWTISNMFSIGQQIVIQYSLGIKPHLFKTKEEKEMEKMVEEGPKIHPGLQVAEDKIDEALHGKKGSDDAGADANGGDDEPPPTIRPPKPKKKKKKR